jgi:hypothetical protein
VVPNAEMGVAECPELAVDVNKTVRRQLNVGVDESDVEKRGRFKHADKDDGEKEEFF